MDCEAVICGLEENTDEASSATALEARDEIAESLARKAESLWLAWNNNRKSIES